ncbi:hypothetical protein F4804DRAFT_328354 [Jackrogersella minutella]|nr:hypothetical protein F4804DRAFT_328354 [Jackrogersella minutella]
MGIAGSSNSGDLRPVVLAIAWVFAGISTSIVALRFYVRLVILRKFKLDDYIILITLLFGLGNSVCLTISSYWGLGKHIQTIESDYMSIIYFGKWVYICEFFSIMCPGFGRISFAFLLLDLTPPSKARRRFLWAIIFIQFVADVGTVIIIFAQCKPIEGFWDKRIKATCWPADTQVYAGYLQGSICAAVDLALAIFPSSLFWSLNMHWKQKAFLSGIMGLGIFAMIASIMKTIYLREITATSDQSYNMAMLAIWWTLEANLVLIAVSIPTVRPILKAPATFSRDQSGHHNNLNTFLSWKQAHENRSGGSQGPFELL